MNGKINKSMLWFSLLMVVGSAIVVFEMVWLFDMTLATSVNIVQMFLAIWAISIGGWYAWVKLQIFREFSPNLTIDQTISHRKVGTENFHISVTAHLYNSSKVAVSIREALYRIQMVAPATDEEVRRVYEEYSLDEVDKSYMGWPFDSESIYRWADGTFVIEPGGTDREVFEFIVPTAYQTILLYAYFSRVEIDDEESDEDNETQMSGDDDDSEADLWEVATVYDLR